MSLEIIGAGFGRTGTKSLKTAIDMLGFGPCYHMTEVKENEGHRYRWHEIVHGAEPDWDSLFANYRATVDWPSTHYWRELTDFYPDAKVILSIRDPEQWYKSFSNTIHTVIHQPVPEDAPEHAHLHRESILKIIQKETFNGRDGDMAYAIGTFLKHAETVARTIAPERLLIYEIAQGWGPLCAFLGVPIPAEGFPHKNTTEDFLSQDPARK